MSNICTSIEQSRKLLELGLDPNTADMYYQKILPKSDKIEHNPKVGNPLDCLEWYNKGYTAFGKEPLKLEEHCIPAWSLSAIIELIPEYITLDVYPYSHDEPMVYSLQINKNEIEYFNNITELSITKLGKSLLDASFNMMLWLIENYYIKIEE